MNVIRIETNCKVGTLTQDKESNFKEECQGWNNKRCWSCFTGNNVKNKVWMLASFSPRPDTPFKAMDEKVSVSSILQSFFWYLQNTFESLTKYAEIYSKLQANLCHWKIFNWRNIFKPLESVPKGTDCIAISRMYYWSIFAKFILSFRIYIYLSIIFCEINILK